MSPRCGFSAKVVEILDALLPEYATVDVLEDPAIREDIKLYTNWPTIPQLYSAGEFVGGCDIILEMHASGELQQKFGLKIQTVVPEIIISDAAKQAISQALLDADEGEVLRFSISARFEHGLTIAPKQENDVEIQSNSITFFLDPLSASRANGLEIDYVTNENGEGFDIKNPNAPKAVQEMSPAELDALRKSDQPHRLFDVREQSEWDEGHIDGAEFFGDLPANAIESLDKATPIVFQCRSGRRSLQMANRFRLRGFSKLYNLSGGILAWNEFKNAAP